MTYETDLNRATNKADSAKVTTTGGDTGAFWSCTLCGATIPNGHVHVCAGVATGPGPLMSAPYVEHPIPPQAGLKGKGEFEIHQPTSNPKDRLGTDKVPLHLLPAVGKIHQAMGHRDGAIKYGPFNWREEQVCATIYLSAIQRHLDDYMEGEEAAKDSGVHHLGHIMACCAIILDAEAMGQLVDDRPTKGQGVEVMEKWNEYIRLAQEEK